MMLHAPAMLIAWIFLAAATLGAVTGAAWKAGPPRHCRHRDTCGRAGHRRCRSMAPHAATARRSASRLRTSRAMCMGGRDRALVCPRCHTAACRPVALDVAAAAGAADRRGGGNEERDSSRNAHRGHPGIQRGHEPSTRRLRRSTCDARSRHPRRERRIDGRHRRPAARISAFRGSPCRSGWESGEQCAPAYGTRARRGYTHVVRVDGDGQHRACDIARLLVPVLSGTRGCRARLPVPRPGFWHRTPAHEPVGARGASHHPHETAGDGPDFGVLVVRSARPCAPGGHHPGGYAEPELVLFLSRNSVRVVEVPIRMRPRLSGRTSLTAPRAATAFARTALALLVVPFRRIVEVETGD